MLFYYLVTKEDLCKIKQGDLNISSVAKAENVALNTISGEDLEFIMEIGKLKLKPGHTIEEVISFLIDKHVADAGDILEYLHDIPYVEFPPYKQPDSAVKFFEEHEEIAKYDKGKCPICGSKRLSYESYAVDDDWLIYNTYCRKCGEFSKEYYKLKYISTIADISKKQKPKKRQKRSKK